MSNVSNIDRGRKKQFHCILVQPFHLTWYSCKTWKPFSTSHVSWLTQIHMSLLNLFPNRAILCPCWPFVQINKSFAGMSSAAEIVDMLVPDIGITSVDDSLKWADEGHWLISSINFYSKNVCPGTFVARIKRRFYVNNNWMRVWEDWKTQNFFIRANILRRLSSILVAKWNPGLG